MTGWNLFTPSQSTSPVTLAEGVTGTLRIHASSGWVFLNGREVVVPSGAGVIAVLPDAARPVDTPLYGLIGRTGNGLFAHFSITTPGGAITLRQGTAHTIAVYFTLSWPQAVRRAL